MPALRHLDNLGTARFVTFTCYRRHRYLTTRLARRTLLDSLAFLRIERDIRILGWVMKPEHVHLVLLPPEHLRLGNEIGRFKSWTARQIFGAPKFDDVVLRRADGSPALWQRRCYDHNCRTPDTVREQIAYCHLNPVRRGLVNHPSEWPWSSYNWYCGAGMVVLEIDGLE